jgi:hypothetical protein
MSNDYSYIELPFRESDIVSFIAYYRVGKKRCKLEMSLKILLWPKSGCSLSEFGTEVKKILLDESILMIQHQVVYWEKFIFYQDSPMQVLDVFDSKKKLPFIYLLSNTDRGILSGRVSPLVMHRFEVQRLNTTYSKYLHLWGIPLDIMYLSNNGNKEIDSESETIKKAIENIETFFIKEHLLIQKTLALRVVISDSNTKDSFGNELENPIVSCKFRGPIISSVAKRQAAGKKLEKSKPVKKKDPVKFSDEFSILSEISSL